MSETTLDNKMSDTPTIPEVGLRKVKRVGLKKVYAVRIQPPDFQMDEQGGDDHKYLFYYTSRNYKSKRAECTKHIWRRAEGRSGPGVVRDGFDAISSRHDFLLHVKPGEKDSPDTVVGVDVLPATTYTAKTNAPLQVQECDHIELAINVSTGEIEFMEVPIGVSKQQIQQLITEIDKKELIQAGDVLGGVFNVYELQGNRLKVAPPARGASTSTPGQV